MISASANFDTLPQAERVGYIARYLSQIVAHRLRKAATAIDLNRPITSIGVDSLLAVEMRGQLEADFGVAVSIMKFLEGPTLTELAHHVVEEMAHGGAESDSSARALDNLDSLSPDEAAQMLARLRGGDSR